MADIPPSETRNPKELGVCFQSPIWNPKGFRIWFKSLVRNGLNPSVWNPKDFRIWSQQPRFDIRAQLTIYIRALFERIYTFYALCMIIYNYMYTCVYIYIYVKYVYIYIYTYIYICIPIRFDVSNSPPPRRLGGGARHTIIVHYVIRLWYITVYVDFLQHIMIRFMM